MSPTHDVSIIPSPSPSPTSESREITASAREAREGARRQSGPALSAGNADVRTGAAAKAAAPGRPEERAGHFSALRRLKLTAVAALVLLLTVPALAEDTDRFEVKFGRDLPFRGGRVTIDHGFGQLVIRTHAGGDVQVRATIRSSDEDIGKQIRIVTSDDGGVTVRTEIPELSGFRARNLSYSVDMSVTIPATAPLTARNRFGNIDVRGLQTASSIENKQGAIKFADGRGAQSIGNSFGAVEVEGNRGNLTVSNSNGSIAVRDIDGLLNVTNRFGSIDVANVKESATLTNANGSIEAMDIGGSLKVTNAFGNIKASTVTGSADITTSNARVELSNVNGSAVVRNSFGNVIATTIRGNLTVDSANAKVDASGIGGDVKIETAFGGIALRDVGGKATVASSNGNIKVSDVGGTLDAETRFGSVHAERIRGSVKVDSANGSVTLEEVGPGAQVKATFGSVFIDGVTGPVAVANANGAVSITGLRGKGCQPVSLATSFSSIKLALPANAAYDVNARTSFGRIHTDLPITTRTFGESALTGRIGAGGCRLDLVNANGNITIEAE